MRYEGIFGELFNWHCPYTSEIGTPHLLQKCGKGEERTTIYNIIYYSIQFVSPMSHKVAMMYTILAMQCHHDHSYTYYSYIDR